MSNHRLSIVFSLIVLSCRKRGVPGHCAFIFNERLHFSVEEEEPTMAMTACLTTT